MRLTAVALFIAVVISMGASYAIVPPYMNYQGVLTGPGGEPLPDGLYGITFRIYGEPEGGEPLWEEGQDVMLQNGIFNVMLGISAPLGDVQFDGERWLGITVEAEEELYPRIFLTAVPYSFHSRGVADSTIQASSLANGAAVRSLNGLTDHVNIIPGANIAVDPIGNDILIAATGGGGGVSGSGVIGQVAFWDGAASLSGDNMLFWDSANQRLGIGTTGPNARLRVESDELYTLVAASLLQSNLTEVFRANYLGGGNYNATAIKGISRPADGYGIGGDFEGGYKGLEAEGNAGDNDGRYVWGINALAHGNTATMSYRYGIWAEAYGPTDGNNLGVVGYGYGDCMMPVGVYGWGEGDNRVVFGVYGEADGTGIGGKYGIYGEVFGAGDSAYAGYFDGNLVYTGSFYKPSDQMFKTNIRGFDSALEKVMALQPRKYNYRTGMRAEGVNLPPGEHYGLVAQEVEEVFPELVGNLIHPGKPPLKADDPVEESIPYKGIDYVEMIPILIQAIKEQQQTIEELKAEIEELKRR